MAALNLVQQCLNLAPVPCLGVAFGLFKSIWDVVQLLGFYKFQLKELAKSVALLLSTLNDQYRRQEPLEASTWDALSNLGSLLTDILDLVKRQKNYGFFKLLFIKDDMQKAINAYHLRITGAFRTFQIVALLDIQSLQQHNKRARENDHEAVLVKLREMESNQNLMINELKGQKNDPMVTVAALQKRLYNRQGDEAELRFFSNSLDYIKRKNGIEVEYEEWMITSLEVEFGKVISKGGFGVIYQGKWKGADVALKVLKNTEGVTPLEADLRREIKAWSILRHPNVLQFIGVSVLDDDPFIVMPLMKHGNVRDYLDKNPNCNRLEIIHQISVGIAHLHSKNVIHGDLKAANVLIDDGGRPLICDFGLSRIKENVDSRSSYVSSSSARGSPNWMAPERLEGGSLRKPCDIYSFAMTMYEIHCNSNPFGALLPGDFRELVAAQHRRPARPHDDEAPQLTEDGWQLMTKCWAPEPIHRHTADAVSAELDHMTIFGGTGTHRREDTPQIHSRMPPPASRSGQNSGIPSRRQTTETSNSRPNGIQKPPNRTQTHHTYHQNIMDRSQSLPESAQHAPFSIIQDGFRSEPMEMEEPSPPYRRNFSNPTYGTNNRAQYSSQGPQFSPPSQPYIPPPYPSPPHSAPSYSPTAMHTSYHNNGSYVPNVIIPQDNSPSQSSYPPADNDYSPMRSQTIGPTMNPGGVYASPPYSSGPYAPPPLQLSQSRSLTLPVPTPAGYHYDNRARSPDPAFPQPFYPS
ncbi:kinase-like domain-containing protein [Pholiota molesta]|nr:kinase-like domain-containing protein [Pholiota molesta]